MEQPTLEIVRGLPGSGKTTEAKKIMAEKNITDHYEADMFITVDGEYKFSPGTIHYSHNWCQSMVAKALMDGKSVVVSNTFTQQWQITPYLIIAKDFDAKVILTTCKGEYGSIHGVPASTIERMKSGWEDDVTVDILEIETDSE